jgi:hypothetical protein
MTGDDDGPRRIFASAPTDPYPATRNNDGTVTVTADVFERMQQDAFGRPFQELLPRHRSPGAERLRRKDTTPPWLHEIGPPKK